MSQRITDAEIAEGYLKKYGRSASSKDLQGFREIALMLDIPQDQSYDQISDAIERELERNLDRDPRWRD